jgi:phosphoribosyl-ATP pyrophosphohydrolase/phosphoribosyl-AMP cyclohydrolase
MKFRIADLNFDEHGLIPTIVQDASTRDILTLAFVNRESLEQTLETGETWFWSRSRNKLWHKGETSGNTQRVVEVRLDCDQDAIVVLVEPAGPACHTGELTCFHNAIEAVAQDPESSVQGAFETKFASHKEKPQRAENLGSMLAELYSVIEHRERARPEGSYTTYLFNEGLDKILKKVGEESAETIIAAKNQDPEPFTAEVSDLLYHLLVLLVARGVSLNQVGEELARRRDKNSTETSE